MDDLFDQISNFENLLTAFNLAKIGNRQKNYEISFEHNLEQELGRLVWELKNGFYLPSAYYHFIVSCPKMRAIAAPDFRDRIVQQSLVGAIEPVFEKVFIHDSYACRKDKGTHFGAKRVKKFLRAAVGKNGAQVYVLQSDIKSFFASMDWSILFELVKKKIDEARTLGLIKNFITKHPISPKSTQSWQEINKVVDVRQRRGLPIGNLTSQLFANVYLNELDHFVKEKLRQKWYGRYMDDFLIIGNSKEELWQIKHEIAKFVDQRLALRLHPNKTVIYPAKNGVAFVGYRIFHDHVLIRGNSLLRMQRLLKKRKKQLAKGEIDEKKFNQTIASFKGHLKHANEYWLYRSMIEHV